MKSDYESTLDKNFEKALGLCEKEHSYNELIQFLKDGDIAEKQYAALVIDDLKSEADAHIFISDLINCDGKIREAVAQKISEFIKVEKYQEYFKGYPEIFAKSTIDINANISRMIVDSLVYLKNDKYFGEKYSQCLMNYIDEAFDGLEKIVFRDKKYTINKQLFKLYWCLEGMLNYSQYIDNKTLHNILLKTFDISEYTVREKAANLILQKADVPLFLDLLERVVADENYYVKMTKTRL